MAFRDITEILGPITLPINGKTYTLPILTIEQGLRIHTAMNPNTPDSMTDPEFFEILLGDAHKQMAADNIAPDTIARAAFTALADWQSGRPAAELIWEQGIDPKALTEAVTAAQALISTSTAAATATPSPAPTSTTKSPKKRK